MPFFRPLITLLLVSFTVQNLFAQLEQGNSYFQQGNYEAALNAYKVEQTNTPDGVAATFGISKIMAMPEAQNYNLDSAYYYIRLAQKQYGKLKDGQKDKLEKKELGGKYLSRFRNAVADSALAIIKQNPSLANYNHFLSYYDRINRKTKEEAINALLLSAKQEFEKGSDFPQIAQFFKQYESEIRKYRYDDYAFFEARLFDAFIKTNGWEAFNSFKNTFPNSRFSRDSGLASFLRIRNSGQARNFTAFVNKYPSSAYKAMARDSIKSIQTRVVLQKQTPEEILAAIEKTTDPEVLKSLDEQLANNFKKSMTISTLEAKLPKDKIQYLPKVMDAVYEHYLRQKDMDILRSFREKYPQYHNIKRINFDLLQLEMLAQQQKEKMKEYDEIIRAFAPSYEAFIALQRIIADDIKKEKWDKALAKVNEYAPFFKDNNKAVSRLINILEAPAPILDINRLGGESVNGPRSEYSPVLTAEGDVLYFCRRITSGGAEAIYASTLQDNGTWSEAEIVSINDNVEAYFAPLALSTDGTQLVVFKSTRKPQKATIGYVNKMAEGWSVLKEYSPMINQTSWQGAATLSSNGRVLIFEARFREDAIPSRLEEQRDLFIAIKNEDGSWGKSVNLGEVINTPFNERSPFLHPDMRTLYFSSAGHSGLGGLDIFKTTRLDDSWTEWSEPEHLGKGINTASHDWGYKISTNGETAYYSASPDGQSDIYTVTLPESFRPNLVSTLTLYVIDEEDNPLEADVLLEDFSKNTTLGELRTDPVNGKTFVVLPHEGRYGYVVSKEGYIPVSNNVDLEEEGKNLEVEEVIRMRKISEIIKEQGKFELKNLFFDFDKYTLQPASFLELDRVAQIIKANNVNIAILGHTDNQGAADYNQKLSQNRAQAVKDYLVKIGLKASQINVKGLGESQPIETNDTEEGRAKNRRVEIQFLSN